MKKWLLIAALLIVGIHYFQRSRLPELQSGKSKSVAAAAVSPSVSDGQELLARVFAERRNNVQVSGHGVVTRVLSDDNEGSHHQRFLLRLSSGQTLLVAHNIDLAPRLSNLRAGDKVSFSGEYEWNERGGVIHWTHRDPAGKHVAGWLRHQDQIFQ